MTWLVERAYHTNVPASRSGARQCIAAGVLVFNAVFGWPRPAAATTTSYDVNDQAIVQIIGRVAAITVRTWNRNSVAIDYPDGEEFTVSKGTQQTRASYLIPTILVEEYRSASGPVMATLLPEDFPVPHVATGIAHDVVRVQEVERPADVAKAPPDVELTITIPQSTGLLNVRSGKGSVTLNDYRGTTIASVGRGRVVFNNVGGDAFVQPLNGHFYAVGSNFDRLRIRSNHADQVFDACRVKQIEATTLTGNIIFDNGGFDPGLARFESDRGSIALGVNGGAQISAQAQNGHVLSALPAAPPAPPLLGIVAGDTVRVVGSGGPLVNAASLHGNVFLYDGSLTDRHPAGFDAQWHPMVDLLVANRSGRFPAAGRAAQGLGPAPRNATARPRRWRAQPRRDAVNVRDRR